MRCLKCLHAEVVSFCGLKDGGLLALVGAPRLTIAADMETTGYYVV